jgi:PhnB protein
VYDPARGYPVVVPVVLYDDPDAAAAWLGTVLGFRRIVRATLPDGWVGHVEVERDGYVVLLARRGGEQDGAASLTQVFVADVEAACARAVAAGGTVPGPPGDCPWGVRQALVADPEGQRWAVSQHLRDTDPADWYGEVFGPVPG